MYQYPNYYQGVMQPNFPQQMLNGRVVDSFDSIAINDIPMDGNISVFPKRDLSEICVKRWTPNGQINTVRYTPVLDTLPIQPSISTTANEKPAIQEDREDYQRIIDELQKMNEKIDGICVKTAPSKSRKDVPDA